MRTTRLLYVIFAAVVGAAPTPHPSPVADPAPIASPSGIASESSARTMLSGLRTRTGSVGGYDRDLFPHWITQSGACNTREVVLARDGTNVRQDSSCAATSGTWRSPYDGATWTAASDVDIDHMVPLSNAWQSGANTWTTAQRQAFANDLTRPQLWAVTDNVNQAKSDQSPDQWRPPLTSFYCVYARSWITVKDYWDLSVTSAERSALGDMLNSC